MQLMGVEPKPFDNYMWKAIYMFHMPLYFLISSYVYKNAMHCNFKDLCMVRSRTLLLPLCIWS